jgi:hypothetical protein
MGGGRKSLEIRGARGGTPFGLVLAGSATYITGVELPIRLSFRQES